MHEPRPIGVAALARASLLVALLVLGAGAAHGWLTAWASIEAHGYRELGFGRSSLLTLCDAPRASIEASLAWSAFTLALVFVVLALAARAAKLMSEPASIVRAAAARGAVGWASAIATVATLAGLAALRAQRDWLGVRDCAFAALFAIAFTTVLAFVSRLARSAGDDPRRIATVRAALATSAALAPALFWFGADLAYHPTSRGAWTLILLALAAGAVLFVWGRARELSRARSRLRGPVGIGAALSAVLAIAPYGLGGLEGALGKPSLTAAKPHNVLVIAIDTLRYDATSIHGPNPRGRDTTPNLRRLAERGIVFDHAIAQAPWTVPSFASILTGRYPNEHGAYLMSGHLRDRETTLAEVLREAGLTTIGVVSQFYLKRGSGFDQGCERFDESSVVGEQSESSERVTDVALAELAAARKPYFAFVHYFDPHSDYLDQPDFPWADGYRGWLREQMAFDGLVRNRHAMHEADLAFLRDTYDEEIAHTDRQIGRLLDELDRTDAWKDTLVMLVVDHGEEFLEHGNFGHTVTVFEELVHVPLIVVPRGSTTGSRFSGVVEARDVFATVLDELDVDFAVPVRERSLLRTARAPARGDARAFTITWPTDAPVSSGQRHFVAGLREGSWKLIHDWTRERVMLFDLGADPLEQRDLLDARAEVAGPMREALDRWTLEQRKRDTGAARRKLDADEQRMMRALGYAGSDE